MREGGKGRASERPCAPVEIDEMGGGWREGGGSLNVEPGLEEDMRIGRAGPVRAGSGGVGRAGESLRRLLGTSARAD